MLRHAPAGRAPRVLLLERALPSAEAAPTPDLRVFALSRASERILRAVGGWDALVAEPAAMVAYERMHVWPMRGRPRGEGALSFDAAELGESDLGHIVTNTALQRAALAASDYGATQPAGPPTGAVAYPYYTTRGPRDFLAKKPPIRRHARVTFCMHPPHPRRKTPL
ncbi:MAG: hypothetical protein EBS39_13440, partial [Gammaproteobacteria bacterium]|nr:hypothetical protein [Gammaproteobacteria bacterium]